MWICRTERFLSLAAAADLAAWIAGPAPAMAASATSGGITASDDDARRAASSPEGAGSSPVPDTPAACTDAARKALASAAAGARS